MKQVIRYLYEYENGNRIRNVGFIKLEKRMDKCAIHIHGKNLDFGQKKKLEVFVFYVQGGECIGIPQGVIEEEAPMINYILKFEPEDAGGQEMFDKLAGIILRNVSEKTYAAMWEEEAADVEHMTTGQREVLEEAATEAVPEERQQSEEPKVRESLIEHVEKLVEQQEFQEEIEKYIPPKTRTYEKIQRQDIARLPRTQWHLANNSFLLHGFYNYHHLLYIEKGKIDGSVCLEFIMKKNRQQQGHLDFRNFTVLWMRNLNCQQKRRIRLMILDIGVDRFRRNQYN